MNPLTVQRSGIHRCFCLPVAGHQLGRRPRPAPNPRLPASMVRDGKSVKCATGPGGKAINLRGAQPHKITSGRETVEAERVIDNELYLAAKEKSLPELPRNSARLKRKTVKKVRKKVGKDCKEEA